MSQDQHLKNLFCDRSLRFFPLGFASLLKIREDTQLFILAIADPLSELEQKTDSLCLPNLELLSCALACVA
jgi:hypothetical protein